MNRRFLRLAAARLLRYLQLVLLGLGIGTACVIFIVGCIVCFFVGLYFLQH